MSYNDHCYSITPSYYPNLTLPPIAGRPVYSRIEYRCRIPDILDPNKVRNVTRFNPNLNPNPLIGKSFNCRQPNWGPQCR